MRLLAHEEERERMEAELEVERERMAAQVEAAESMAAKYKREVSWVGAWVHQIKYVVRKWYSTIII